MLVSQQHYYYYYSDIFPDPGAQHCNYATLLAGRTVNNNIISEIFTSIYWCNVAIQGVNGKLCISLYTLSVTVRIDYPVDIRRRL